jgi:hypothetical protein
MFDVMQRMHSGRNPTFRALAMRQDGDTIIEAAEWKPRSKCKRYMVVYWKLADYALNWNNQPSRKVAISVVRATRQ